MRPGLEDAKRPARIRALLGGRAGLVLGISLLLLDLVLANLAASRFRLRSDWTRSSLHSLSGKTLGVLGGLGRRVRLVLIDAPSSSSEGIDRAEVRELLLAFSRRSRLVSVEDVDLDADPSRAALLARRHSFSEGDLREGVVLVESDVRKTAVPLPAMVEHQITTDGQRRRVAFKGEAVLLGALLSVVAARPAEACFTRDHGEAALDSFEDEGYALIAAEAVRDGYRVRLLPSEELLRGAPDCSVIVVGGPTRSFAPIELDAIDRRLRHGGRLLVLHGPVLDRRITKYGRTGLETLLASWGAELPDNVLLDRYSLPGDRPPMTWAIRDGYGTHEVVRPLAGRITVWPLAREVRPKPGAQPGLFATSLARTSADGWGETDLASLRAGSPTFDAAVDSRGPVSVAVAATVGSTRLVVLGTERGVLNQRLREGRVRDLNRELFLSALAWLSNQERLIAIGPKVPELARLSLDDAQLRLVFLIVVVGLPALPLLVGLIIFRRRRR